jgi:molybdate transport system substrate-binding protein
MKTALLPSIPIAILLAACSPSGAAPASVVPATAAPSSAPPASPSTSAEAVDLTVFAAASLADVLETVKTAYEAAHPGTTLTISTDASSALETKIEQGAPADLFLSADTTNPQMLVEKGLTAGEAVVFATNELAIIVPSGNPGGVTSAADLARPGLKVIAAGDEVPISTYAKELIDALAKSPGAPADLAAAYARNVVSKEDNVKAVVGKIELGEGDVAIVYATDAKASTKVTTVEIPAAANVPARYTGAVVGASAHQEPARTFLGWLTGPDGQAILASFGFKPPS